MAYIKRVKYNELVGGQDNTDVYPITQTKAVYEGSTTQKEINARQESRISALEIGSESLIEMKGELERLIEEGGIDVLLELKAEMERIIEAESEADFAGLKSTIEGMRDGTSSASLDGLNKIIHFLEGMDTSDNLEEALEVITRAISSKQDTISDIVAIRNGAALGATALQSFTEQDPIYSASPAATITAQDISNWNNSSSADGTVKGILMNGEAKPEISGIVNLGTVITNVDNKANVSDVYTKAQTYSKTETYNKNEVESYVANELEGVVYFGDTVGYADTEGGGDTPVIGDIKTINNQSLIGTGNITIDGSTIEYDGNSESYINAGDSINECLEAIDTQLGTAVHKTGSETIRGNKTFVNEILFETYTPGEVEEISGGEEEQAIEDTEGIYNTTIVSGERVYHVGHDDFSWIATNEMETTEDADHITLQSILDSKAANTSVVHNTGNEDIQGVKGFFPAGFSSDKSIIIGKNSSNNPILKADFTSGFNWIVDSDGNDLESRFNGLITRTGIESLSNKTITSTTFGANISFNNDTAFNIGSSSSILFKGVNNHTVIQNNTLTDFSWIKTGSGNTSLQSVLDTKQTTLISGTNIKTINGESILGSGNITIEGGSGGSGTDTNAIHKTGDETISGTKTLQGTLSVNTTNGGEIKAASLNDFSWIKTADATTLQSVITALTNRVTALETALSNLYSYNSSTGVLTINDPSSNS